MPAACRYGGATPGGMGMGIYLVWPAFYTDVTDTYRLSLAIGAVLVLPKLVTSAWDSGRVLVLGIPREVGHFQVIDLLASVVRLLALALPVLGGLLVSQKIVRTTWGRAR